MKSFSSNHLRRFHQGQRIKAKWDNGLALSGLNSDAPYPVLATVIGFVDDPAYIRLRRDGVKSPEVWKADGWEEI